MGGTIGACSRRREMWRGTRLGTPPMTTAEGLGRRGLEVTESRDERGGESGGEDSCPIKPN